MKHSQISVPWKEGLHLRPAALVVKLAREFRCSISLRLNGRLADARSIVAMLLLSATCGSVLDLEASGTDEDDAIQAITALFDPDSPDGDHGREPDTRRPV